MSVDRSLWLVIAFAEPPRGWGFVQAKSQKCWWRRIEGREWAINLGKKLAEMDIHGKLKRLEDAKSGRSDRKGLDPVGGIVTSIAL